MKALTELENEANNEGNRQDFGEKVVEKASASAVSIYTKTDNSDDIVTTTVKDHILSTEAPETATSYAVVVQKSDGIEQKAEVNEQIQTSASNSFQTPKKYVTKSVETTTSTTTPATTTEESQAKVEDVQFFSAPLVAAFTVHQDETGVAKKVEPIYKTTKKPETNKENVAKLPPPATFDQERFAIQQKRLEQEIAYLKQQQQQQEQLLKQQLLKEKLLQEQIRQKNNDKPFRPMAVEQKLKDKPSTVALQPSITVNPFEEAGKLPQNAHILPVKNAIDFRTPFIQSPTFQQFQSIQPHPTSQPLLTTIESLTRPHLDLVPPHNNRILRQETNVANFGFNNDFRAGGSSATFSIQPSIQSQPSSFFNNFESNTQNFIPLEQNNRFFRSNFDVNPIQNNFLQQQPNRFFRSNNNEPVAVNRFNQRFQQPQANNYHLNNLLYNSGAIHGRPTEDFNIITKVLSLNHLGSDSRYAAASKNVEVRVPVVPYYNHV